jgi:hypothetical protein
MKKIAVICAAVVGLAACGDVKKSEEYQSLLQEKTRLAVEADEMERSNREILHFITQIEDNLAAIREREMGIRNVKNDPSLLQEDRVTLIVAEIGTYFDENRNIIDKLEARVKDEGRRNGELIRLVALQKQALAAKEKADRRTGPAGGRPQRPARLHGFPLQRGRHREGKATEPRAAGAQRQGKGQCPGLLQVRQPQGTHQQRHHCPDGGVLGIGKSITVSAKLNPQNFTPLDIRKTSEIPLGDTRKQRIVTTHPGNSYRVVEAANGGTFLKITDPDKFWSVSKYLVVVVE